MARSRRAGPHPVIVDSHTHLWDLSVTPQPWIDDSMSVIDRDFSAADLKKFAGGNVARTVTVQTVADAAETPILLANAANSELIGAVVGWVDLTAADVDDALSSLISGPDGSWLRGIRHQVQGEPDPRWLCRNDVRRGLSAVGSLGLVYELLTLPNQMEAAAETVEAMPELSFVIDHISKPPIATRELEPWATNMRRLASAENVTCKLSGLVTEADWSSWAVEDLQPYADVALESFGPDRVMFGSDWPVCLLASSYERVFATAKSLTTGLSDTESAAVFGGTAARVYGIEES